MKATIRYATALALATMLAACGSAQTKELTLEQKLSEKKLALGPEIDRVRDYRLTGWNYLDREHVIIHTGPSSSVLITLKMPCNNLSTAEDIGFTNTVGSLTKFDRLVVRDRTSNMTERCVIDSLNELEKIQAS